jgi:hypothetical protein
MLSHTGIALSIDDVIKQERRLGFKLNPLPCLGTLHLGTAPRIELENAVWPWHWHPQGRHATPTPRESRALHFPMMHYDRQWKERYGRTLHLCTAN